MAGVSCCGVMAGLGGVVSWRWWWLLVVIPVLVGNVGGGGIGGGGIGGGGAVAGTCAVLCVGVSGAFVVVLLLLLFVGMI